MYVRERERERERKRERMAESAAATYLRIIMIKYFFGHKYTSETRDPRGAAHPTHIARCTAINVPLTSRLHVHYSRVMNKP